MSLSKKEKVIMADYNFKVEHKGFKWFHTDYGLSLSKAKLGLFMYHLLKMNGGVCDIYCMNPKYDRACVNMSVCIHPDDKSKLEELTKVKLIDPPVINLN